MYSLLSRISGALDPLRANFEKYVHKVGMQAIDEVAKTAINVRFFLFNNNSRTLTNIFDRIQNNMSMSS